MLVYKVENKGEFQMVLISAVMRTILLGTTSIELTVQRWVTLFERRV